MHEGAPGHGVLRVPHQLEVQPRLPHPLLQREDVDVRHVGGLQQLQQRARGGDGSLADADGVDAQHEGDELRELLVVARGEALLEAG
jgi:hypothetical protein